MNMYCNFTTCWDLFCFRQRRCSISNLREKTTTAFQRKQFWYCSSVTSTGSLFSIPDFVAEGWSANAVEPWGGPLRLRRDRDRAELGRVAAVGRGGVSNGLENYCSRIDWFEMLLAEISVVKRKMSSDSVSLCLNDTWLWTLSVNDKVRNFRCAFLWVAFSFWLVVLCPRHVLLYPIDRCTSWKIHYLNIIFMMSNT